MNKSGVNSTYDHLLEKCYLINTNPMTFVAHLNRIMKLNSVFVGKKQYTNNNTEHILSNIINVDNTRAVVIQSENNWYIYLRYFNYDTHQRCGEQIVRKFLIDVQEDEYILTMCTEDNSLLRDASDDFIDDELEQINDKYEDFIYDNITEGIKDFKQFDLLNDTHKLAVPPKIRKLLFEHNLFWFDMTDYITIKLTLYPVLLFNVDTSHPVHMSTCMTIEDKDEYGDTHPLYYSEIQNYASCCGGGEYSFIQCCDYESMIKYDFWKELQTNK